MTEVPEAAGSVKRVASAPAISHAVAMKPILLIFAAVASVALAQETPPAPAPGDPDIAKLVSEISAERIERSIHILTSFTTRHTLSDPSPSGNDIGAARAWIRAE